MKEYFVRQERCSTKRPGYFAQTLLCFLVHHKVLNLLMTKLFRSLLNYRDENMLVTLSAKNGIPRNIHHLQTICVDIKTLTSKNCHKIMPWISYEFQSQKAGTLFYESHAELLVMKV